MSGNLTNKDINLMILRYFQESGFEHAAFQFENEMCMGAKPIGGDSVSKGALITVVKKGLQLLELEANMTNNNMDGDEDFRFIEPSELITKILNEQRVRDQEENENGNSREGDTGPLPPGASSKLILNGHSLRVSRCAWSPTGSLLASGSDDGTARIWRIPDGSSGSSSKTPLDKSAVLVHPKFRSQKNMVLTLDWNDKGTRLVTGSHDGKARIWNVKGDLISTLEKHKGPILALKWNTKGNYLVTGSFDKSAILWDMETKEFVRQFGGHKGRVYDVDWRDVESFATSSSDFMIRVFRIGRSRPIKTFDRHEGAVKCIKWNPSGSLLASGSTDTTVKIWSMNQYTYVHDLQGHSAEISVVRWSPTQELLLASASFDSTVKLWDTSNGKVLCSLEGHSDRVATVAFSHDGQYLATGSRDGSLYILSVKDTTTVSFYKGNDGILEVCWNKEGNKVAISSDDGKVGVFDLRM